MKQVVKRLPFGCKREDINKVIRLINVEYGDKVVCQVSDRKVMVIKYRDLVDADLFSIGEFVGKTLKVE